MAVTYSSVPDVIAITASGGDDLATFQAAIAAGRTIHLPDALYKLSDELHITASDCHIIGAGVSQTEIRRITNTGDAVIRFGPAEDISLPLSTWPVIGGGLERVKVNANNLADHAVHQRVHFRGVLRSVMLVNPVVSALKTSNFDTAGSYNEVAFGHYEDVFTYSEGTADGVHLEGSYHLRFDGLLVTHAAGGVGIFFEDVDDIFVYDWAVVSGAGGVAIELNGSDSPATAAARNCTFVGGYGLTGSQTIIARGGSTYPSRDNLFLGLSTEDVVGPTVTIEDGAICRVVWNTGDHTLSRDVPSMSEVEDEFVGASAVSGSIGAFGWTTLGSTSVAYGVSEAEHPGVIAVTSSGTGLCGIIGSPASIGSMTMTTNFDLLSIAKPESGSDATSMYRIGWGSDPTADPPEDGVWFEKLYADTQWFAVSSIGGVKTRSAAIANVTAAWFRFRIRRQHSSIVGYTIGSFLANENLDAALSNSGGFLPTMALSPFVHVRNSAGSARTFSVDYVRQTLTGMAR